MNPASSVSTRTDSSREALVKFGNAITANLEKAVEDLFLENGSSSGETRIMTVSVEPAEISAGTNPPHDIVRDLMAILGEIRDKGYAIHSVVISVALQQIKS